MTKVLIVNNMEPFVWGGAEELAINLRKNLELHGHEAEILRIPFRYQSESQIPGQMLLAANLQLQNVDKVIALKFPSYLLPHPVKTFWLLHQFRQAYDLREAGQGLSNTEIGDSISTLIRGADFVELTNSKTIFCNSRITKNRLKTFNGIDAEILHPPVNEPGLFRPDASEGYIFAGGRINTHKRQELLVESLKYAAHGVRLLIVGPPDNESMKLRLLRTAETHGVTDRVHFSFGFHRKEEIARLVNSSLACAYIPEDEDSFGYVAMEAAEAGKALITTSDSGGVADMVIPRSTGWRVESNPQEIGRAMTLASKRPNRTKQMGLAARENWQLRDINWDATIEKLLR